MDKKLADYITWYKDKRVKLVPEVYVDKSTRLKRMFLPYSKWDASEIIEKEINFSAAAINKLINSNFTTDKKILSISVLAISNRIEYISDQADFFPVLAALIAFSFTYISIGEPLIIKIIIGACALGGILFSLSNRSKLRQEVAHYKEIVNVLNQ